MASHGAGSMRLQMAMRNPPELKAIIAMDATEELFHDDIHYIDGIDACRRIRIEHGYGARHDGRARLHAG